MFIIANIRNSARRLGPSDDSALAHNYNLSLLRVASNTATDTTWASELDAQPRGLVRQQGVASHQSMRRCVARTSRCDDVSSQSMRRCVALIDTTVCRMVVAPIDATRMFNALHMSSIYRCKVVCELRRTAATLYTS